MKKHLCNVYIIHLNKKLHHSQHYVGLCYGSPAERLKEHQATKYIAFDVPKVFSLGGLIRGEKHGDGAKMLAAANAAGIGYFIDRVFWEVDAKVERWLKDTHHVRDYCKTCSGENVKYLPTGELS